MVIIDNQAAGPHDASVDHERLVLEARDVDFDWAQLPFHYAPGEPFATHVLNVLHLLLPAGEQFFVEVFKQALPLIRDDQLRLDVQGFIGQEGVHSRAHANVLAHFAARGIDLRPYTGQIEWLFGTLLGPAPIGARAAGRAGCSSRSPWCRPSSTTPPSSASGFSTRRPTTGSAPIR
ncbi:putative metal-dependent hydrolase family protein [Mycobacterium avium subsp. avium 2285 (R)]|nr:putative metal-dependent hydrolase family protein [Mycobacterium avium subsp. avium 2285 (R)]